MRRAGGVKYAETLLGKTSKLMDQARAESPTGIIPGERREVLAARFKPSFVDCIDAYAADHGINRSDALRLLVIKGLESEGY